MLMMSELCVVLYGFFFFIYENSLIMIKFLDLLIFIKLKKEEVLFGVCKLRFNVDDNVSFCYFFF